jgi:hypothetical protein
MRKDMWLRLQGAKTGHLHIALTVVEHNFKSGDSPTQEEEGGAISVSNDATATTPAGTCQVVVVVVLLLLLFCLFGLLCATRSAPDTIKTNKFTDCRHG